MFWIRANDHDFAMSFDDSTFGADRFDGRSDFHSFFLLKLDSLFESISDTAPC